MENRRITVVLLRYWFIVAGFIITAFAAGIYSTPYILKNYLPQLIEVQTGTKATLGDIKLGLFPVRLALKNFGVQEIGSETLLSFERLDIQLDLFQSLKRGAVQLDQLVLTNPFVSLSQKKEGGFTIQDLFGKSNAEKSQNQDTVSLCIRHLEIHGGQLAWQLLREGKVVKEDLKSIDLQVENFSLVEDSPFDVNLSLALASGGQLDWRGFASLQPIMSQGHIKLADINLSLIPKWALKDISLQGTFSLDSDYQLSYANGQFKGVAKQTKLAAQDFQYTPSDMKVVTKSFGLDGDLSFEKLGDGWLLDSQRAKISGQNIQLTPQQRVAVMLPKVVIDGAYQIKNSGKYLDVAINNGEITIQNAQLQSEDVLEPLLKFPVISVQGINLRLNEKSLKIGSVTAKDAAINAWMAADGTFNYQTLFTQPAQVSDSASTAAQKELPKNPWSVRISNFSIDNGNAAFEDRTFSTPTLVNLNAINIKLNDVSNQLGGKIPFTASLTVNQSGKVKIGGASVLQPFGAHLNVNLSNLQLEKFQPYYNKFVNLDIIDGSLSSNGQLDIGGVTGSDGSGIAFNGNIGIESLVTRDRNTNKDFIKWENCALQDLAIDTAANRYSASVLTLERPYARVTIRKDKSVNISSVLNIAASSPQAKANLPALNGGITKPWFKLEQIRIIEGSSDFTDLSLILPFAAHIESLDGGASGISSEKTSSIKLMLSGNAYELAPVGIKGVLNPHKGNYDIQVNFSGLPMPLVSPYMVQFAGYKVERGKMNLDLSYQVTDKQLTASNKLLIDHFELGDRVDNPNAASIPIKLAVSLLKDSNGKIRFDVPVTGSLEDPRFDLGMVISDAFTNTFAKIAEAPFSAIASLFDYKETALNTVSFAAGATALTQTETVKLDTLAKALQAKPELNLGIKGTAFLQQDWPALTDDALYDQLKKRRADEINKTNRLKIRPEYVQLSDDDFKRLLADMFIEKFPQLANKSIFGTPQLKNSQGGDFYEVAKLKLYELIKPEEERLKGLAIWRAQSIAKYLVEKGGINQGRIYILDTRIDPPDTDKKILSFLTLSVD